LPAILAWMTRNRPESDENEPHLTESDEQTKIHRRDSAHHPGTSQHAVGRHDQAHEPAIRTH
jgi:hypothetical protein